ncbi:hypothetical protein FFLO_01623 [Filobasidium floriforme]|uniref:Uncharacterized protein n=1 Tax=Filobasidium floriforme TaxID=5210 RepID=A0A8K0JQQ8_9TREE|nr:uncharacterized protein HD553DRAFT_352116 [Filobasidium floriforme]KAG7562933.1 hypothetical protein FFLO_01623 [Filobasidium floriforme]KAH8080615.1 hypothetical protein HD553DRAFT_352116 [Filobasidium floriforme]
MVSLLEYMYEQTKLRAKIAACIYRCIQYRPHHRPRALESIYPPYQPSMGSFIIFLVSCLVLYTQAVVGQGSDDPVPKPIVELVPNKTLITGQSLTFRWTTDITSSSDQNFTVWASADYNHSADAGNDTLQNHWYLASNTTERQHTWYCNLSASTTITFIVFAESTRLDTRGDLTTRKYFKDPESYVRYQLDNGSTSHNFTVTAPANETAGQAGSPANDADLSIRSAYSLGILTLVALVVALSILEF